MNSTSSPLVSIGFPVYNGEKTMRRTLDSILGQDFTDFELVIADNASTDSTQTICEDYAQRDKRVRYFRNETNIGVSPNHNRVFELSRGKYFAWAAHDMVQLPGMLSRCVEEITKLPPTVVLVCAQCELFHSKEGMIAGDRASIASSDPRPHRRVKHLIRNIGYVTQFYGLIVSDALKKTRLHDSFASADYILAAELAMLGEIREIPIVLVRRTFDVKAGSAAVVHSQKDWSAWLDPKMKGRRYLLPIRERLALNYVRSAWRLPLRTGDKLACLFVAPATHYKRALAESSSWGRKLVDIVTRFGRLFGR